MIEWYRDPIWQFIGAILAFIAIVLSIYLYRLQKREKSLSYRVVTETALLPASEDIAAELQVVYKGTPVEKVHLLVLEIINNGNEPITSSDFETPLTISFGEKATILSAEITRKSPKTLKPNLNYAWDTMQLDPLLLNRQDTIAIKLLIARYESKIEPEARIIGVKEVKKLRGKTGDLPPHLAALLGAVAGIGGSFIASPQQELLKFFALFFVILLITTFVTGVMKAIREAKDQE